MSEPETLERYLDDFGVLLVDAAASDAVRRRRRRRMLAPALTGALAASVALAVLIVGGPGERLDPLAEARAALAPPGEIVYMQVTSRPVGGSSRDGQTTEQWSTTDPLRWRMVYTVARPPTGLPRAIRNRLFWGRVEESYGGGVRRTYGPGNDRVLAVSGHRDDDPGTRLPAILGAGSGDPRADLRAMLFDGTVRDLGEQTVGGRRVRRFVSERRRDGRRDPLMVLRLVYDVDPSTFEPLQATFSHRIVRRGSARTVATLRMHVDEYRRIALDATTSALLKIKTTPRTKVFWTTVQKQRAGIARRP